MAISQLSRLAPSCFNRVNWLKAFQVDHLTARVQKNQIKTTGTSSFDSLKSVAPIEQYEHLRQILYKQKKKYIEHAIFRD